MGIQINGNTNNINAGIGSLSIEDLREIDIVGVATASNFKTGISNLHNLGLTLSGGQLDVGSNIKLGNAGVITATSFVGSGANLTNLNASNIASGTVPTARLGSGTANSSTFLAGDSTYKTVTGTTINNNANNRVITGSGTANTLEGESKLTFDPTTTQLKITRDDDSNSGFYVFHNDGNECARLVNKGSGHEGALLLQDGGTPTVYFDGETGSRSYINTGAGLAIGTQNLVSGRADNVLHLHKASSGTADGPTIYFTNQQTGVTGSDGFTVGINDAQSPYLWNRENTALRFGTNNAERLRIDSSGRVMIGTTTEGFATYGDKFTIANSGHCGMTIRSGTSNYGTLYFSDGDDGSAAEVRGFVEYNHSNNQLSLGSDGISRLRIKSDGRLGINADPSVNHEYLHIKPVGNNVLDLRYELNSDTDIRHKFYDNAGVWRGGFNYTTYANSSAYPNFHDSFYFLTDPGSNGTLSTALRITNTGQFIKPLTYQFFLESSGTSVSGGWNKLTGMSLDSTHCTGVSNGTYWSNSNQRFTAPVTGTYQFFIGGFSPTAEGGGTNHRYMYLFRINGGNYKYGMGGNYSDNNTPMEGGTLNYKLTVNDYVEVWYYTAISATWGNSSHRFFWGGILLG